MVEQSRKKIVLTGPDQVVFCGPAGRSIVLPTPRPDLWSHLLQKLVEPVADDLLGGEFGQAGLNAGRVR